MAVIRIPQRSSKIDRNPEHKLAGGLLLGVQRNLKCLHIGKQAVIQEKILVLSDKLCLDPQYLRELLKLRILADGHIVFQNEIRIVCSDYAIKDTFAVAAVHSQNLKRKIFLFVLIVERQICLGDDLGRHRVYDVSGDIDRALRMISRLTATQQQYNYNENENQQADQHGNSFHIIRALGGSILGALVIYFFKFCKSKKLRHCGADRRHDFLKFVFCHHYPPFILSEP